VREEAEEAVDLKVTINWLFFWEVKDEAEEAVDDLKLKINWLFFWEVREEAEEAVHLKVTINWLPLGGERWGRRSSWRSKIKN